MLHSLARPYRALLVMTGSVLIAPALSPLAGQVPTASDARLQGVVVEQSGYQPVDSATVSVVGTNMSVTTDKWGAFAFREAPLGSVSLRISAPGHPSMTQEVEVKNGRIVFVQVELPSVAAMLQELLVRTGRPSDGTVEAARSAADLLADRVPRTRVNTGIVGKTDYAITLRSITTLTGTIDPIIVIDGVMIARASDAFDALERIPASDVEEIQVLKGPDAFQYPFAANGAIVVKTKRGKR
jgi:outer membrane receptor protein involved in Fe transport